MEQHIQFQKEKMKIFIKIFSLFLYSNLFSQVSNNFSKFLFKENEIYLCYRGTEGKRNLIAGDFNITESPATHLGLGLKINGKKYSKKIN